MTFVEDDAPPLGYSFGLPFTPTHRDDQVEAALRGYFAPRDLEQLARLVGKDLDRRHYKGKPKGQLAALRLLLSRASRPPVVPVAMRWFASREGGEPLPVRLLSGDRAGAVVTLVPPGETWEFTDPEDIPGQVWCQPVDDQGADLGARAWGLDSGTGVRVGSGRYLIPFDAIRTGDGADAQEDRAARNAH